MRVKPQKEVMLLTTLYIKIQSEIEDMSSMTPKENLQYDSEKTN